MGKTKKVAAAIEAAMAEVAAAESDWELDLSGFEELEEGEPEILRPNQLKALVDISSIGHLESNTTTVKKVQQAARDNGVPILFGGFYIRFNKQEQTLLCVPTATHKEGDKNSAAVTWSADGLLHADFELIMAKAKWKVEPGFKLRVFCRFVRKHPQMGSMMLIPLNQGEVMDAATRVRKQNQRKKGHPTCQMPATPPPTAVGENQG